MSQNLRKYLLWGGGVVVTTVLLVAFFIYAGQSGSNYDPTQVCTTDMAITYHIHPHLSIIINGQEQAIPQGVGILPTCFRPLHTHDATGVIHIESPVKRDFTLGEFFKVWGQPFDKNHILGYVVDSGHSLTLTVDGQPSDAWQNLVLSDQQKIVINFEPKSAQATSSATK